MLVLTRKAHEKIWIGADVCVTVVAIDRGRVRLGIEAPKSVEVLRDELRQEQEQQQQKAAGDGS